MWAISGLRWRLLWAKVLALLVALSYVAAVDSKGDDATMYDHLDCIRRYTHFRDTPKIEDETKAKATSEDVKCEVCQIILTILAGGDHGLAKGGVNEEKLLDVFEGEVDKDAAEDKTDFKDERVLKNYRGCNKHFKESYFAQGWDLEGCFRSTDGQPPDLVAPWHRVPWTCVMQTKEVQNASEMNMYSIRMETVYYACQATLGSHTEELAAYMAKHVKAGTNVSEVAAKACRQHGKCERRVWSDTLEDRAKAYFEGYQNRQKQSLDATVKAEKEKKGEPVDESQPSKLEVAKPRRRRRRRRRGGGDKAGGEL